MPLPKSLSATRPSLALGIVIVAALTLLSGAIQGRMSDRWGQSPALATAAAKLQDVPGKFGQWRLRSSGEISETTLAILENPMYILREYENQETNQTVNVAILAGRSGPISVHLPEICYSGAGYKVRQGAARVRIPTAEDSENEFWAVTLGKDDPSADGIRVYYGWSIGGAWSAPDDARFRFIDSPYLYKIQLASNVAPSLDGETSDICREFLRDFVVVAKEHLVGFSSD